MELQSPRSTVLGISQQPERLNSSPRSDQLNQNCDCGVCCHWVGFILKWVAGFKLDYGEKEKNFCNGVEGGNTPVSV